MNGLLQDIRYALRQFGKAPGFTAVAVLTLALGIGANTAIFSILNAVLLRSLPVEKPNNLVQIKQGTEGDLTNPIWEQIRDHQQAFSGMLAFALERFDLADGGESHFAEGLWVSGDFFRVLGVTAARGRVFGIQDDQHGGGPSGPVVVISDKFWKQKFSSDLNVIGKTIRLNRHTFEIVGVTPPWFTGLDADKSFDVAIPIGCDPILRGERSALNNGSFWWLRILGRTASGETIQQAEQRIKAITPEVRRATVPSEWPAGAKEDYLASSFSLYPVATGFSATGDQYRTALLTLMAAAGLVLLIACANMANLLLVRATTRQREFSVRMAIGASRLRVIRQLMTESFLLCVLGGGFGILLASWVGGLLVRMISTTGNPLEIDLSPDVHVLAFTMVVAALTVLLFGLAPALRGTRLELNQALKDQTPGAIRAATRITLGKGLVAGQVALSLVLLVGAGLFLTTLRNLLHVNKGFDQHSVLLITADAQQAAITEAQRVRTYQDILDRLNALPGVVTAASSMITPLSGRGWAEFAYPENYTPKTRDENLMFFNRVSPGYFRTMHTPLLVGRDFNEHDNLKSLKTMIIDESAARHFFGALNPLGKTIALDRFGAPGKRDNYQVIGVVQDAKYGQINEELRRTAYLASGQDAEPQPDVRYEVRSDGPVENLIPSIRSAIGAVNHNISLEFLNFETQVDESLLQQRMVALLSSIFGGLALLLAVIGLYGTTAYGVARRTAEIGIRIALGAPPQAMIWLVLRGVFVLLFVGIPIGLVVSLAAGRFVSSLLYGVQSNDPAQLTVAALALALATLLAAYLPARRAAKVDPMVALRYE